MLKWPLEWRSFFFFLGSVYCCLLFLFFVFLTLPCSFFLVFSFLFVTFWQSCGSAEGVLWLNYQLTVLLEDKIDVVCLQPWYNAMWFTRLKALTNFLSSSFLLPILSLPLPPSLYLCLSLSRSVCLSACLSVSVSLSLSLCLPFQQRYCLNIRLDHDKQKEKATVQNKHYSYHHRRGRHHHHRRHRHHQYLLPSRLQCHCFSLLRPDPPVLTLWGHGYSQERYQCN